MRSSGAEFGDLWYSWVIHEARSAKSSHRTAQSYVLQRADNDVTLRLAVRDETETRSAGEHQRDRRWAAR